MTRIAASTTAWAARLNPRNGRLMWGGDDERLEAEPRGQVVHERHANLKGQAGVFEHEPGDRRGRPRGRGIGQNSRNRSGQKEQVVGKMQDAGFRAKQIRSGLARRKRPQRQPAQLPGGPLGLIDARPHRSDVHPAGRVDGGDESFEDHAEDLEPGRTGGTCNQTSLAPRLRSAGRPNAPVGPTII